MAKDNRTVDRIQAVWNMVGGDDVIDQLLAGTAKLTVEVRRFSTLTPVTLEASNLKPYEFLNSNVDLLKSSNFNDFILKAVSKDYVWADKTTIGYADLIQSAYYAEVDAVFPEGHIFEVVDEFVVHLANLILFWSRRDGKKKVGKEDALLDNGRANVFYVKVNEKTFTVYVDWIAPNRKWYCHAKRLDKLRLAAGARVFSATVPVA